MKAYLDRDVRLGILEKVDIISPIKWLSRMLVTMKKDGSPRRIIDYKNLNNAIPRQTNITKIPFMFASACPPKKQKTILDAKDGYHYVVLKWGKVKKSLSSFVNLVVIGASVLVKDLSVAVTHTLTGSTI